MCPHPFLTLGRGLQAGAVTAKCGVYTLVDERPAKFDSWPLNQSPVRTCAP